MARFSVYLGNGEECHRHGYYHVAGKGYGVRCHPNSRSLSGCKQVKSWYGCIVADHAALIDLYHKYSSGQHDNSEPTSDQYAVTGMITCALATCIFMLFFI